MPQRSKPIRVAVIEPSGRLYGSEYCLLDILDGLPRDQFDWRVFLPKGQGFDELLQQREIPCEFLIPETLGQLSNFRKLFVYGRVLNRLRGLRPDLLYVNQTGSLRAAAMYARWLKLPVVCQVQTLEDARWLSSRKKLHQSVYAFICNSQFIADQTDVDATKKCILYQGIGSERVDRTKEFAQARCQRASDAPPNFGILGRIAVSKGHYVLIDAMRQLGDRLPNSQVVVIGEGLTSDDTQAFQEAVSQAGLADRFVFRGYQSDLQQELASVDVLLIPSVAEPLGRVLFDAAEFGVPVVISDAGGLGELGQRFSIGVSFESNNAASLADAMVQIAGNLASDQSAFAAASVEMMQRLNMDSYLESVDKILVAGASRQPCSVVWFGDEV